MESYRSLLAWQWAHRLALSTLEATDDTYHPRARAVFNQLRNAAILVEANIVEGYVLGSKGQFRRHLRYSLASAAEAECLIRLAAERGYLPEDTAFTLEGLAGRTQRLLTGLILAQGS